MKANPEKCHFICSSSVKTSIVIENKQISNSSCEKLLCMFLTVNCQLNHIYTTSVKNDHKIHHT